MESLTLDQQFFAALLRPEVEALDRLLAADFVLIEVNSGAEIAKPDLLTALGLGYVKFESIEACEQRVRRYPATTVITGRTRMQGRLGETHFAAVSRYTHVYVEQQGTWLLAAAQGTPISPAAAVN